MCKFFCRALATIYLIFILSLVIAAIYYTFPNMNTRYVIIPCSLIAVGLFAIIICNIIIISKECHCPNISLPKSIIIINVLPVQHIILNKISPWPIKHIIELKDVVIDIPPDSVTS